MMDDSPYSCPMCGCEEVRWAAPMGVSFTACSCRACGWEYLITREEVECVGGERAKG
jgi:hypothetical protein